MSAESQLRQQLEHLEGSDSSPEDEQTWNILVQILLPLVFVLTFVLITGITAYKSAYEGMRQFLDKDSDFAEVELQEKIVDLQLQRLLNALEQVKAEIRDEMKLNLFPDAERVERSGLELQDDDFRHLCHATRSVLNDKTTLAFFDYATEIYRRVLDNADIEDPRSSRVRRWNEEEIKGSEMLNQADVLRASDRTIVPVHRRQIQNMILDFLSGLEDQLVALQTGLVTLMFDELLSEDAVAELDPTSMAALKHIVDSTTPNEERRESADKLFQHLLALWRNRLTEAGYSFLDNTWNLIEG